MKKSNYHLRFIFFLTFFYSNFLLIAQEDYDKDIDLAGEYYQKAVNFSNNFKLDSADANFKKAVVLFEKHEEWENYLIIQNEISKILLNKGLFDDAINLLNENIKKAIDHFGENNEYLANFYDNFGLAKFFKGNIDDALSYYDKALSIRIALGEKDNIFISNIFNNIGNAYTEKGEFDIALDYYQKSLKIRKEILGETNPETAISYNNIGIIYKEQREYDLAIEYHQKALNIQRAIFGDDYPELANYYQGIGNVYKAKGELDLAMEYYQKTLSTRIKSYGENHPIVAKDLINIGNIYIDKNDFDNAVDIFQKALRIQKQTLEDNHPDMAITYNNIGNIYNNKGQFDLALAFYLNALEIKQATVGEEHPEIADYYNNIGNIYSSKGDYSQALEYQEKALELKELFFGPTHPATTLAYLNIGNLYYEQAKYDKALEYFQKSVISNVKGFKPIENDFTTNPELKNYYDSHKLLSAIHGKAKALLGKYKTDTLSFELENAFASYKECDKLIDIIRKTTTSKTDKIELGKTTSTIYDESIDICYKLNQLKNKEIGQFYLEEAFYFSEKNKAGALLEAIAGSDAQKFAGIPANVLKQEKSLNNRIADLEKKLAEEYDPEKEVILRDQLFKLNREYSVLITDFEKKYPKYFEMKHANKYITVSELQSILDKETALRSYLLGDSLIFIFTITNDSIILNKSKKTDDFNFEIFGIRKQITSGLVSDIKQFMIDGNNMFNALFPKPIPSKIKRLIIIPDGNLGLIPFEALLTEKVECNFDQFDKYPFLINNYDISYQYSSNLYYKIYNKITESEKHWASNNWLGIAPVFNNIKNLVINDIYISSLPGTENEVKTIKNNFLKKGLSADAKLFEQASENFIKSNEIKKYKFLHIATHGFVNSDKPELSGIILTEKNDKNTDGVLYSGEIYNLELNSDLVVLSACETGLGKVSEGEGIIGLSRAILYAGTNNIIVSLWKVADNSTSDLMIDFYTDLLEDIDKSDKKYIYGNSLRAAKLKMIKDKKFGHPFFWSPFILIGK
ncbi:MAG: CHAT domain-containing protein [Bacteroidales bacterium]|nr:CHAT domain-containing protein [Bacteroidales bacterium]MBN2755675.1 CHAT domain-containing protein [Bacteroidales bacterium]